MHFSSVSYIVAILFLFLLVSCQPKQILSVAEPEKTLLETVSPEESGIKHTNMLVETEDWNYLYYFYFYNGAGVATGDINNDGLVDVFLTSNQTPASLYLNKGNFTFEDITVPSGINTTEGWKTGTVMADINSDGFLDIFVCRAGAGVGSERTNLVFMNNGDLTFSERSAELGLIDSNQTINVAVLDYDLDGDLDIFTVNHSRDFDLVSAMFWMKDPLKPRFGDNHLFQQQSDGTFRNVSKEAGISSEPDFSLSATIFDFNRDGWPDIYVCNDFWPDDNFYINNGDGTFTDITKRIMPRNSLFSMGSDAADLNNDGWPDLITVDMMPEDNVRQKTKYNQFPKQTLDMLKTYDHKNQFSRNMLYFGDGGKGFVEAAFVGGIEATDWSWSVLCEDLDNDGWRDVMITNGIKRDIEDLDYTRKVFGESDQSGVSRFVENKLTTIEKIPIEWLPNYIYRNNGDLTFENVSSKWGFTQPLCSQGMAVADFDNDGYLDVIINNTDTIASLYRNTGKAVLKNNFLQLKFKGAGKNKDGLGVKATLYANGTKQYRELYASRGYQSSSQPILNFGLGKIVKIDSVVVVWPSNLKQTITNAQINTLAVVDEADAKPFANNSIAENSAKLFTPIEAPLPMLTHKENNFSDFNVDRLIPRMHSAGALPWLPQI